MNFSTGQKVNVVVAAPEKKGGKPTVIKGEIDEILSRGSARIKTANGSHQASYSNEGEVGTFHIQTEADDVKASENFGQPAPTQPVKA